MQRKQKKNVIKDELSSTARDERSDSRHAPTVGPKEMDGEGFERTGGPGGPKGSSVLMQAGLLNLSCLD